MKKETQNQFLQLHLSFVYSRAVFEVPIVVKMKIPYFLESDYFLWVLLISDCTYLGVQYKGGTKRGWVQLTSLACAPVACAPSKCTRLTSLYGTNTRYVQCVSTDWLDKRSEPSKLSS